jgi:hypothetical protein
MPIRKPSCSGTSRTPGHAGLRAKSPRYFVWLHNQSEGLQFSGSCREAHSFSLWTFSLPSLLARAAAIPSNTNDLNACSFSNASVTANA